MISSEVQRTLVKSPPELWAELSDPGALARHLGQLGEIRIVRTEPERIVEWAAENTTGTVSIKPSGWGTKVTLSVTREAPEAATAPEGPPEPEAVAIASSAAAEPEPTALGTETTGAEPEPTLETAPEPQSEPDPQFEHETQIEPEIATARDPESPPEPRRSFFARLFARRRKAEPSPSFGQMTTVEQPANPPADQAAEMAVTKRPPEQPDAFAAVTHALAPETFAAEHPFAVVPPGQPVPEWTAPDPPDVSDTATSDTAAPAPIAHGGQAARADDISAELLAAEEAGTDEITAVLTAVLDRLGAAHHRPFSRS